MHDRTRMLPCRLLGFGFEETSRASPQTSTVSFHTGLSVLRAAFVFARFGAQMPGESSAMGGNRFGIVRTKNGVVRPKRDERERKGTRRLGIQPMHAHRAAISGNQWQSMAIEQR